MQPVSSMWVAHSPAGLVYGRRSAVVMGCPVAIASLATRVSAMDLDGLSSLIAVAWVLTPSQLDDEPVVVYVEFVPLGAELLAGVPDPHI